MKFAQEAKANYGLGIFSAALARRQRDRRVLWGRAGSGAPRSCPAGSSRGSSAGDALPAGPHAGAAPALHLPPHRGIARLAEPPRSVLVQRGAGTSRATEEDDGGGCPPAQCQAVAARAAPAGCAEFPGLVFMVSPSSDLPQMLTQCHVSDCSLSCAAGG